jgi:hypothetical protein
MPPGVMMVLNAKMMRASPNAKMDISGDDP